ncbi:CDKN2AIP N-terminal-like protein [Protopterus annectens]|uniref:CDKN2AIP N-terminal-like protein n=1 Tax=Protopterus annectens TaxID=7888 RepID=UPI001CFAD62D|nr:CDKN2AIP N-terminal-like protein [Protopterus annectens]
MGDILDDFVRQSRETSDSVEHFMTISESDKHWQARREFILRYFAEYERRGEIESLLGLSMVYANHVFLGCQYNEVVLKKVKKMAEGIEIEDAPQFTTRDEIMKRSHQ